MSFAILLSTLRRRGWIAAVCVALATLITGAFALRSKPVYIATATVIAKNPGNATDTPLDFTQVATSNTVAYRAIQSARIPETVDELERSLAVVAGKSDIYSVSVRDPDPGRATALANAVANQSAGYYQELAAGDTASIQATIDKNRADLNQRYLQASQALLAFDLNHPADSLLGKPDLGAQRLQLVLAQQAASNAVLNFEAGVTQGTLAQITTIRSFESHVIDPAAPILSGGRRLTLLAYGGFLGLVVGAGIAFLLEYFSRSINRPEDAEAILGAPVLGTIPRARSRAMRSVRSA
jgi:uncharacterized protein involved in exopolysaccharide biosynthesis